MNFKISKKQFYIDEKKKTVTCVLIGEVNGYDINSLRYLYTECNIELPDADLKGNNSGKFKAVGKAVCSEEDKFDETLGKRLAENKAKYKLSEIADRYLNAYIVSTNKLIKNLKESKKVVKKFKENEKRKHKLLKDQIEKFQNNK